MDAQFGLTLDRETALELHDYLAHEYISPAKHPNLVELMRRLQVYAEVYGRGKPTPRAEIQ